MNNAFDIASIGLVTHQRALDIHANNIANLNTTAFKRSDVRFSEVVAHSAAAAEQASGVAGVRADAQLALNEAGQIERTNRALDLAIEGAGFIELMGPNGQVLLSRGGHLALNADGVLSHENGLALRAMITVPLDSRGLEITPEGEVISHLAEGERELIGTINLVRVDDAAALERLDGGLYRLADGARVMDGVPGEDGLGRLVQGGVERSNVELNAEMVQLMIIQRAYAANAQVVQAADQLMNIANNLRR